MENLFNFNKLSTIFLYSVLTTFPIVVLPVPVQAVDVSFNKANFALKIQKHVDKILKYKDKGNSEKVISIMLEIKDDIESYTGKKIDLKTELDKINKDISKKFKAPKSHLKSFKNLILSKEKKKKQRSLIMLSYLEDNPGISFKEYEVLYKSHDDNEEEIVISAHYAIGGSLILAGALIGILAIEFPVLLIPAEATAAAGFSMVANEFANQCDKKNKK